MTVAERRRRTRVVLFAATVLELLDQFPGASATSWFRSEEHNKAVGGLPESQHVTYTAVDLVWDHLTQPEIGIFKVAAGVLGLQVVRENDHDHVELAPALA